MPVREALAPGPLAAIDIGSNSMRLEIGQVQQGRYVRIDYLKETVRLGAGLDADGMLTEAAQQRGLDCLRRMARRLAGFEPERVRAVATQTLREARNRNAFLARAEQDLGYPIEVITGREEARLIYVGVWQLQPTAQRRLVIDIGGRSTEMILGQGEVPGLAESFRVGSVSLSMKWFPGGVLSAEHFRQAQIAAGAELEEALDAFAPGQWDEVLGSSGTMGAVADLLRASDRSDGSLTPEGLRWCIERCIDAGHVDRLALPGLREDRRPVIGGGLALLYTLLTHFGIDRIQAARGALRQGVIVELHQRRLAGRRAGAGDLRDATVAALALRFGADAAQAERVRQTALTLYDAADTGLPPECRRELGWASTLHEVGQAVSHHDHHRHTAYLVGHVDAPGFSQSQQRRLADLVLGQRGGLRKVEPLLADPAFAWPLLCLRLAAILCHARGAADPARVRLGRLQRQAVLSCDTRWRDEHPRTWHLLQEEADFWARTDSLALALR